MTQEEAVAIARQLQDAEDSRTQFRALSIDRPEMTIDDAYRVQRAWIDLKLAQGRTVRGHKIGLTSRAMQLAVGIDEPDSGVLLDDMFHANGARIPISKLIEPRVEVELAFMLKAPLEGPDCTPFDVLRATEFVVPALEILDARMHRIDPVTKAARRVTDTIADNAANAAIVVSDRPFSPLDHDLPHVWAVLTRNLAVEETGVAAGVLGNPVNGIVWLANRMATQGAALKPGELILSGSFTRPVDARAGDTFHADFGPLGSVGCHFA